VDSFSVGMTAVTTLLLLSVRRVREGQRLVVFRLNRFLRIVGPGSVIAVPWVDKVFRIDLETQVPHWRSMTEDDVAEAIKSLMRASGYVMPDQASRRTRG
jgi:regulator of protease activity HflC (stomatin/prohibitin superfamily)